eukprot:gene3096-22477_t
MFCEALGSMECAPFPPPIATGTAGTVAVHVKLFNVMFAAEPTETTKVWTLPGLEHLDPFWSTELQCTPAQSTTTASSRSVALRGRPFLHFVLLVGEAMCRSCLNLDAGDGGTPDCSSAGAAAVLNFGPDAGNGTEIVHAKQQQQQQQQQQQTGPLPCEIWLHILSFLRVSELMFGLSRAGAKKIAGAKMRAPEKPKVIETHQEELDRVFKEEFGNMDFMKELALMKAETGLEGSFKFAPGAVRHVGRSEAGSADVGSGSGVGGVGVNASNSGSSKPTPTKSKKKKKKKKKR